MHCSGKICQVLIFNYDNMCIYVCQNSNHTVVAKINDQYNQSHARTLQSTIKAVVGTLTCTSMSMAGNVTSDRECYMSTSKSIVAHGSLQRVFKSPQTPNINTYSLYNMALLCVLYIILNAQFISAGANTVVAALIVRGLKKARDKLIIVENLPHAILRVL